MRNAARLALTALALAAATVCLVSAAGAAEPKMKIDPRLHVSTVCFPVTDPLGLPRILYGKRYTTPTATSSTPAIVLVHGIASSTANWDFSPSWSTARALATAGYVVYSYDRLGYARSSYFDGPGGGRGVGREQLLRRARRRGDTHHARAPPDAARGRPGREDGRLRDERERRLRGSDAGRDAKSDGCDSRSQRRRLDRGGLPRHVPRRRRDDPDEHLRHD